MQKLLHHLGIATEETGGALDPPPRAARPGARRPLRPGQDHARQRPVAGPLLAAERHARVSLPGGCAIGVRPIDQHLKALTALGADVQLTHGYVEATASRLRGTRFRFDMPTVTGTENVMMAAASPSGTTVLDNCAREPEVVDLANLLNAMGARISRRRHGDDRHRRRREPGRRRSQHHPRPHRGRHLPDRRRAHRRRRAAGEARALPIWRPCWTNWPGSAPSSRSRRKGSASAPKASCGPATSRPPPIPASRPTSRRSTWP